MTERILVQVAEMGFLRIVAARHFATKCAAAVNFVKFWLSRPFSK